MRRLTIREGMKKPELERFVVSLATPLDPDDLSEDYVTRLWEEDLAHVAIAAIDPYLELELPEDVLEGNERPGPELEDPGPQPENESVVPPPPTEAFEINEEQRVEMQARVEEATQDPRWDAFVESMLEVVSTPTGHRRIEDLVLMLESTFQRLLSENELALAERIVRWLRTESPEDVRGPLRSAVDRMASTERMRPLRQGFKDGSLEREAVQRLLVAMGPLGAATACDLLREADNRRSQRFCTDILSQIGAPAASVVLREFNRGDHALNMSLSRVLGQLREERAVKPLVAALEGAETLARREWIRALSMIRPAESTSVSYCWQIRARQPTGRSPATTFSDRPRRRIPRL